MKKLLTIYLLVFILTGCSVWSKVTYLWQGRFLKVDTNISKKRWELSLDEKKLAVTFYKFDTELDYITKSLEKLSNANFEVISQKIISNRPWVLGVYLLQGTKDHVTLKKQVGQKLCVEPDKLVKEYPASSINSMTYLIYDNKMILLNRQRKGEGEYNVTSIVLNIKKLAFYKCNLLQKFAIVTDKYIIIDNGIERSHILEIKWIPLIKNKSKGTIQTKSGNFYWMVRFLGEKPIFYLIKE
ncbi:hypothetical protein [Desulfothermus sp.]